MEQGLVQLTDSTPSTITHSDNHRSTTTSISTIDPRTVNDALSPVVVVLPSDDMMDLLRAIEMSRLQALRENEQNIYRPNMQTNQSSPSASNTIDKRDYFNDLQQAIQLSLQAKNQQEPNNDLTSSCRVSI